MSDYRADLEALELLAEELTLLGDPPQSCGVRCEDCGIEMSLPWSERASLPEAMDAHGALCPWSPA